MYLKNLLIFISNINCTSTYEDCNFYYLQTDKLRTAAHEFVENQNAFNKCSSTLIKDLTYQSILKSNHILIKWINERNLATLNPEFLIQALHLITNHRNSEITCSFISIKIKLECSSYKSDDSVNILKRELEKTILNLSKGHDLDQQNLKTIKTLVYALQDKCKNIILFFKNRIMILRTIVNIYAEIVSARGDNDNYDKDALEIYIFSFLGYVDDFYNINLQCSELLGISCQNILSEIKLICNEIDIQRYFQQKNVIFKDFNSEHSKKSKLICKTLDSIIQKHVYQKILTKIDKKLELTIFISFVDLYKGYVIFFQTVSIFYSEYITIGNEKLAGIINIDIKSANKARFKGIFCMEKLQKNNENKAEINVLHVALETCTIIIEYFLYILKNFQHAGNMMLDASEKISNEIKSIIYTFTIYSNLISFYIKNSKITDTYHTNIKSQLLIYFKLIQSFLKNDPTTNRVMEMNYFSIHFERMLPYFNQRKKMTGQSALVSFIIANLETTNNIPILC